MPVGCFISAVCIVTSALHSERCMAPLKYIARTSSARPPIVFFWGCFLAELITGRTYWSGLGGLGRRVGGSTGLKGGGGYTIGESMIHWQLITIEGQGCISGLKMKNQCSVPRYSDTPSDAAHRSKEASQIPDGSQVRKSATHPLPRGMPCHLEKYK